MNDNIEYGIDFTGFYWMCGTNEYTYRVPIEHWDYSYLFSPRQGRPLTNNEILEIHRREWNKQKLVYSLGAIVKQITKKVKQELGFDGLRYLCAPLVEISDLKLDEWITLTPEIERLVCDEKCVSRNGRNCYCCERVPGIVGHRGDYGRAVWSRFCSSYTNPKISQVVEFRDKIFAFIEEEAKARERRKIVRERLESSGLTFQQAMQSDAMGFLSLFEPEPRGTCQCEHPGLSILWHLDNCLKNEEQTEHFKNKMLEIIEKAATQHNSTQPTEQTNLEQENSEEQVEETGQEENQEEQTENQGLNQPNNSTENNILESQTSQTENSENNNSSNHTHSNFENTAYSSSTSSSNNYTSSSENYPSDNSSSSSSSSSRSYSSSPSDSNNYYNSATSTASETKESKTNSSSNSPSSSNSLNDSPSSSSSGSYVGGLDGFTSSGGGSNGGSSSSITPKPEKESETSQTTSEPTKPTSSSPAQPSSSEQSNLINQTELTQQKQQIIEQIQEQLSQLPNLNLNELANWKQEIIQSQSLEAITAYQKNLSERIEKEKQFRAKQVIAKTETKPNKNNTVLAIIAGVIIFGIISWSTILIVRKKYNKKGKL